MNLIEKILASKEVEVARMKRAGFVAGCRQQSPAKIFQKDEMRGNDEQLPEPYQSVRRQRSEEVDEADCFLKNLRFVIAEVKPQSPSGRVLIEENEVADLVAVYSQHAAAISVLCDREFFGGGYDLLKRVAGMTDLPLLAKEFFVDRRQVYAAAAHGASAILLIPALISEEKCLELLAVALDCGLDVLLEFHELSDVKESLVEAVRGLEDRVLIGVNNRDLRSLEMDMSTTARLMPELKRLFGEKHLFVAESGIENGEMAKALRPFVDGFLIGTGLLQASDRQEFFNDLK